MGYMEGVWGCGDGGDGGDCGDGADDSRINGKNR
jgi:hypothetical protein